MAKDIEVPELIPDIVLDIDIFTDKINTVTTQFKSSKGQLKDTT